MKALSIKKPLRLTLLAGLLAALGSLTAHASVSYTNSYTYATDPVAIPQGGSAFSVQHVLGGMGQPITSVQLILTFSDGASLTGADLGIHGLLTLGTAEGSPYYAFMPWDNSGNESHIYTSPTITALNGVTPNNTWALVLWDTGNNNVENTLVGWSLGITVVPEPVNVALATLGVGVVVVGLVRRYVGARKSTAN